MRRAVLAAALGCLAMAGLCGSALAEVPVPPASDAAVAFQHGKDAFFLLGNGLQLLIAALLLPTGWAAALRDLAARLGRGRRYWTVSLSAVLVTLVSLPPSLLLAYGEDFWLPHSVGISNESLGHWLHDQAIGTAISLAALMLVVWVPYWLLRRYPKTWAWRAGACAVPLLVVVVGLSPVLITPLFNHFTPLADKKLEAVLRAEATRVGLGDAPILVMDQSTTSKSPGAYVTGLFGSRRIVLFDTLLQGFDQDEIRFVLGHEAKHYLLNDVWKLIGLIAIVLTLGMWGAGMLSQMVITRLPARTRIASLDDPASFALLQASLVAMIFMLTPVVNLRIQSIEHEADRFGLELTQNNDAAARAFVKLQTTGLGVPDPGMIQRIWRTNHPPLRDRITFANTYHPWADGTALRYGAYIAPAIAPAAQ